MWEPYQRNTHLTYKVGTETLTGILNETDHRTPTVGIARSRFGIRNSLKWTKTNDRTWGR